MPWWQSPFSSSGGSHSDDSILGGGYTLKSAIFSRRSSRQLTRAKKVRHLSDIEVDLWHSTTNFGQSFARATSGDSAPPTPQPLPLPDLQLLLRNNVNSLSNSNNLGFPSPRDVVAHQLERERTRGRTSDRLNAGSNGNKIGNGGRRLSSEEVEKSIEQSKTWSTRRSPRDINGTEKFADNYGCNVHISAPTSPNSSPRKLSCYRGLENVTPEFATLPPCFQVWSAPEMPSTETTLGQDCSYRVSSDKMVYSVDNCPLRSPQISPRKSGGSLNRPMSPLQNKLPTEKSLARRESYSQANVHPLPLPPGAVSFQSSPVPQFKAVPEVKPVNSQWRKGKLIGRGTFGSVYVASNRETAALCAMKEVEMLPDDSNSAESIKQLEQEINVLSNLKHPNIVQYYGSEIVGDRFYIYLEYVHPGSLTKFIRDHCEAITESVVRNFTRHILCGLAYLHSRKTIHRDIKGANLLVDAYGVVKLADFGTAKHLHGHKANLSLKGTPYWMAPELLQSEMPEDASVDVALAADIWSLGCTVIEMMTGRPPWSEFEGAVAMFKVLKENPQLPDNLSDEGRDFLNCCFRRNPAERPTASMLLEHRFVKGPHQPDLSSCSGIQLVDNMLSQGEHRSNKVDQVPVYYDSQTVKGKLVDNEISQRCHFEVSNLRVVSYHSPRSTLDALPGLSPPHAGYCKDHSST